MVMRYLLVVSVLALVTLQVSPAHAQNTAGVPPPGFPDGHVSWQYRAAFETDTDAFAHRLHYQEAIDEKKLWRVIVQGRKTGERDNDFDFAQAELFWRLTGPTKRWQHGLRFDARFRHEGRPGSLGINWSNEIAFGERWQLRGVVLTAIDIGDGARDGVFVQTRARLNYQMIDRTNTGIEMYSVYGSSKDFAGFQDQSHIIGPYIDMPFGNHWRLFASALGGITDNSQDLNLKLWVTRAL
ncbi:MAG: hypothetical protein AAGC71_07070 [Pseudomonadota bacterium]